MEPVTDQNIQDWIKDLIEDVDDHMKSLYQLQKAMKASSLALVSRRHVATTCDICKQNHPMCEHGLHCVVCDREMELGAQHTKRLREVRMERSQS